MGELLEDLGRRRRLQAASRDRSNKAPGGLAEVVLRPYREREDRRVDDDQRFAPARISSSSALSLRISGGSAIDRADRIAFAAARLRSRGTGNSLSIASRTSAPTDARRARASACRRRYRRQSSRACRRGGNTHYT